jgi:hypothetical protein
MMARRYQAKAFTLVEVLVIVLLCVCLLIVVPLVLRRPRSTAFRMTCAPNLAGIGKAMLIYANDYEDTLPRAGGPSTVWAARTPDWMAEDRYGAFGQRIDGSGGTAAVSASLYLLVRYVEVEPKSFVCARGEPKAIPFRPARYRARGRKPADLWDFGPNPPLHCSYAYHVPYGLHALTISGEPGLAVAADRNPWIDSPFAKAQDFSKFKPDIAPFGGTRDEARRGNAVAHKGDGQNVLFLDSHVEFAIRPFCGIDDDNIYTSWNGDDKARGTPPKLGSQPADKLDSLLVNDPAVVGGGQ